MCVLFRMCARLSERVGEARAGVSSGSGLMGYGRRRYVSGKWKGELTMLCLVLVNC